MKRKEYGTALNWNYIIICIVIIAIITLLLIYVPNIRAVDMKILNSVQSLFAAFPHSWAVFFSTFGFTPNLLWPQIAACSVLISHQKYLKAFLLVFFTQATFIITDFMKMGICRQRPCGLDYPGYSFPSGHSSTTMCFYGILIYLVLTHVRNDFMRFLLTGIFGLWICMVAISRMCLNVHFPLDITAGLALGFLMVNMYIITAKFFNKG